MKNTKNNIKTETARVRLETFFLTGEDEILFPFGDEWHIATTSGRYLYPALPYEVEQAEKWGIKAKADCFKGIIIPTSFRFLFSISEVDETEANWAFFKGDRGYVSYIHHHYFFRYAGEKTEFFDFTTKERLHGRETPCPTQVKFTDTPKFPLFITEEREWGKISLARTGIQIDQSKIEDGWQLTRLKADYDDRRYLAKQEIEIYQHLPVEKRSLLYRAITKKL